MPQSIPHLVLVDRRVPVLCAQMRRDKVVHFLAQVLIGRLPEMTESHVCLFVCLNHDLKMSIQTKWQLSTASHLWE